MTEATVDATVDLLNDLLHLDHDAVEAYQAAIARLESPTLRSGLEGFLADHRTHIVRLEKLVRSLDGEPVQGPDLKRILTEGKVVLRSIQGDAGILKAMKSNEDDTNKKYEEALKDQTLRPEIRDVLAAHLSDERRHREWIVQRLGLL